MSYSRHADKKLDELYERQNRTLDVAERERLVQEAEVPVLWRNRIIVHNEKIKGWSMSPSHFQGTDLVESGSTSRRAQAFGLALARTACANSPSGLALLLAGCDRHGAHLLWVCGLSIGGRSLKGRAFWGGGGSSRQTASRARPGLASSTLAAKTRP